MFLINDINDILSFSDFLQYFKDFGDIIKETVSKSKLISPVQSAKTVCLSLQQVCI